MLENIRLSLQGLWSHKMRSFLTMLGIIIGIAAIIAIVSTIKGTNEQIKENLIGSGDNTVNVQLYQGDNTYEIDYYGVPDGVPVITEETRKQILELDHIENASLYTSRETYNAVYYLNTGMSGGIIWTPAIILSSREEDLPILTMQNSGKWRYWMKIRQKLCFRASIPSEKPWRFSGNLLSSSASLPNLPDLSR